MERALLGNLIFANLRSAIRQYVKKFENLKYLRHATHNVFDGVRYVSDNENAHTKMVKNRTCIPSVVMNAIHYHSSCFNDMIVGEL
jgi:hypothetical protein